MAATEMTIKCLKCVNCKHEWYPRENRIPRQCPRCKDYYWQGKKENEKTN